MDLINRIIHALTELHPTHPMIVHFPIALTGAAFLFVLLAAWRKNPSLEQAAYANLILAFLGTIAAAITGIMDNARNYEGAAPNGGAKVMLASILFLLIGGTLLARSRNPNLFQQGNRFLYISAYGVSFVITLILAFLGGVILYGF
jgi:uncharacterized membrane protein